MGEKRRLPDAGLAANHDSAALPAERRLDEPGHPRLFPHTPDRHGGDATATTPSAQVWGFPGRDAGRSGARSDVDAIRYGKRLQGRFVRLSADRARRIEVELPDGATFDSEVMLAAGGAFREHGTICLATGSELHFRTLGAGSLVDSPDPDVSHGSVIWELDGGTGRFEHASGRISSTFTVGADGRVDDEQHGLIFVNDPKGVACGPSEH